MDLNFPFRRIFELSAAENEESDAAAKQHDQYLLALAGNPSVVIENIAE